MWRRKVKREKQTEEEENKLVEKEGSRQFVLARVSAEVGGYVHLCRPGACANYLITRAPARGAWRVAHGAWRVAWCDGDGSENYSQPGSEGAISHLTHPHGLTDGAVVDPPSPPSSSPHYPPPPHHHLTCTIPGQSTQNFRRANLPNPGQY